MELFIAFLEGIITFISPCLLPMLPIYVSYFAGGNEQSSTKVMRNALGFILGFTCVFCLMGALAGTVGAWLLNYQKIVNVVTGLVVIFFGLNFLGVFKLTLFKGSKISEIKNLGFFSSLLFGVVFSIGWTPCVGAFLGAALMMAASEAQMLKGLTMLLLYSFGLGIPFFISAILIDKLKGTFNFIKKHYKVINLFSGLLLVSVGFLMAIGLFGKFLNILS